MFSQRLTWNLAVNRLNRALAEKQSNGAGILDLTESNPTRAGFNYSETAWLPALANPRSRRYDPSPHGLPTARAAVAAYYAARSERVDPQNLFLTASTSEAYAYLFKLLADPGDEILAPLPCYPLLDFLAALESVQLQHYPLQYEAEKGWHIDFATLANVVTTRTAALVLVHPNNPTGSFVKPHEIAQLNALCAEHALALICDEVFLDYASGDERHPPLSLVSNGEVLTFVVSGLSKIAGLPQMKLAWIHVNGPDEARVAALERLEYVADTYLSVGTPVQWAAEELLAVRHELQRQIRARLDTNYAFLLETCRRRQRGEVLLRQGGWYAVLGIPAEISEEEFAVNILVQENVLVHPGYFYDFPRPGFLVLSLLTPIEIFQEGVVRIFARL
ncbi:MAG: pyridoxal phosphate-dependent aminotransferase [bacterium]